MKAVYVRHTLFNDKKMANYKNTDNDENPRTTRIKVSSIALILAEGLTSGVESPYSSFESKRCSMLVHIASTKA